MAVTELKPPLEKFSSAHWWDASIPVEAHAAENIALAGFPTTPIGGVAQAVTNVPTGLEATDSTAPTVSSLAVAALSDMVRRASSRSFEEDRKEQPQLTPIEVALLVFSAGAAAATPFLCPWLINSEAVDLLVPGAAAITAAVGVTAEYKGKIAVSDGKEVAATAIATVAESEMLLAEAECIKAIIPVCVGASAWAGLGSLLAPALFNSIKMTFGFKIITQFYLVCPLVAVVAVVLASLSTTESGSLCTQASDLGVRRFASAGQVGYKWSSASDKIFSRSQKLRQRWKLLTVAALPGPLLGALCPGGIEFKAIIAAHVAATQCAFYIKTAEQNITCAVEAVSLKARTAAIADRLANQGMKSGSILPFTSAIVGLSAAACAAIVEVNQFAAAFFPAAGALVSAAAAVSKARAEIDAQAAAKAASSLGFDTMSPEEEGRTY